MDEREIVMQGATIIPVDDILEIAGPLFLSLE